MFQINQGLEKAHFCLATWRSPEAAARVALKGRRAKARGPRCARESGEKQSTLQKGSARKAEGRKMPGKHTSLQEGVLRRLSRTPALKSTQHGAITEVDYVDIDFRLRTERLKVNDGQGSHSFEVIQQKYRTTHLSSGDLYEKSLRRHLGGSVG